ncbi:hypothetical protein GIB67_016980 [Kingdonia uniflora]|uniref:Proline-tRNA ligase class II C-terminal domain-containing protein n=1 Tax=Kingdonia uniflora TaxID=39325 RepID=A0A7J7M3L1_9MAGN|nr:hypothetical protein GIB67_016980 [Kingdonia uniflora]
MEDSPVQSPKSIGPLQSRMVLEARLDSMERSLILQVALGRRNQVVREKEGMHVARMCCSKLYQTCSSKPNPSKPTNPDSPNLNFTTSEQHVFKSPVGFFPATSAHLEDRKRIKLQEKHVIKEGLTMKQVVDSGEEERQKGGATRVRHVVAKFYLPAPVMSTPKPRQHQPNKTGQTVMLPKQLQQFKLELNQASASMTTPTIVTDPRAIEYDADELRVKEETSATIRCFPFDQPEGTKTCLMTGNPAQEIAIFAKSY